MLNFVSVILRTFVIFFIPVAAVLSVASRQAITGDQYAAVREIVGTEDKPGSVELLGTDIRRVAYIFDFIQTWSAPVLVVMLLLVTLGLLTSTDKLRAVTHIFLGLFFSFGFWTVILTQSYEMFNNSVGPSVSQTAGNVLSAYLLIMIRDLVNFTGLTTLLFGLLALGLWVAMNRRQANTNNFLN